MNRGVWIVSLLLAVGLGWAAAMFVSAGTPLGDEEDAFVRFSNALTLSDSFERTDVMLRLAEQLTPENMPGAVRAIREDIGQRSPIDIRIVMWAWAEQDPRGMLAAVQDWPDLRVQRLAASEAVSHLIEQEGYEAAKDLYDQIPTHQRDAAIPAIVLGFLEHEPVEKAFDLIETYAVGEEADVVAGIVTRHMMLRLGSETVQQWVESLPPGTGSKRDVKRVAYRAAQEAHLDTDQLSALETWLERVDQESWAEGARRGIAVHWVKREPEAAIEWARRLSAEQGRVEIVGEAVRVFASLNATGAYEWLMTQEPEESLDRGTGRVAVYFARRKPAISLQMIDRIVSDRTFQNARRTLTREWRQIKTKPRREKFLTELETIAAARGAGVLTEKEIEGEFGAPPSFK